MSQEPGPEESRARPEQPQTRPVRRFDWSQPALDPARSGRAAVEALPWTDGQRRDAWWAATCGALALAVLTAGLAVRAVVTHDPASVSLAADLGLPAVLLGGLAWSRRWMRRGHVSSLRPGVARAPDLDGLQTLYRRERSRPLLWLQLAVTVLVAALTVVSVVQGSTWRAVFHGVLLVGLGLGLGTPRSGETVTVLRADGVGVGTRTLRGMPLRHVTWDEVDTVRPQGPWDDLARLVLRDGREVVLPAVPRQDAFRLAAAVRTMRAAGDAEGTPGPGDR